MRGFPETQGAAEWFNLSGHVSDLANSLTRSLADAGAPHGLLPAEVLLLAACGSVQACTASQLASTRSLDASGVSRLVDRLVERGMLRRRRVRSDRRLVMLHLSPEGHEVVAAIGAELDSRYARLVASLSDDRVRAFAETAQAIVANYERTKPACRVPCLDEHSGPP